MKYTFEFILYFHFKQVCVKNILKLILIVKQIKIRICFTYVEKYLHMTDFQQIVYMWSTCALTEY